MFFLLFELEPTIFPDKILTLDCRMKDCNGYRIQKRESKTFRKRKGYVGLLDIFGLSQYLDHLATIQCQGQTAIR